MWVKQLPSGKISYCERYTDNMTGKTKYVSVSYNKDTLRNQKEALSILNERIKAANSENKISDITLSELIDLYRKDQKRTVKESTYSRNYFAMETIKKILGEDVLVRKLTAGYIRERFLKTDKPGGMLNEHLKRFKAVMRWGYRSDLIESIAFLEKIESFPDVVHKEKIADKFLESEQIQAVLKNMKHPVWQLLTEFLVLSGLRCGEAIALEKKDVDLKNHVIHISKTYDSANNVVTTAKTINSISDITIQPQLEDTIKKINVYMTEQARQNNYKTNLFMSDTKGAHLHYYSFNKYFKENVYAITGKQLTTHSLRHTHASLLFEQGFTVDEVARRLRHGDDSKVTKEVYIHVTEKLKKKDSQRIMNVKLI